MTYALALAASLVLAAVVGLARAVNYYCDATERE